jgi:hypothetical protein
MKFVKCPKCNYVWLFEGVAERSGCPESGVTIYMKSNRLTWPRFAIDATPTSVAVMPPAKRVDLAYIYVDVWNRSLKLGIVVYADDGWHARVRLVDPTDLGRQTDLDISIADLEEAVWDAGGSIDCSGKYPLNATLRERLGAVIEQPVAGKDAICLTTITSEPEGI